MSVLVRTIPVPICARIWQSATSARVTLGRYCSQMEKPALVNMSYSSDRYVMSETKDEQHIIIEVLRN